MTAPKHTKGPWIAMQNEAGLSVYIYPRNEKNPTPVPLAVVPADHGREYIEANAARIVACVNAMEGIKTPTTLIQALREMASKAYPAGYGGAEYVVDGDLFEKISAALEGK